MTRLQTSVMEIYALSKKPVAYGTYNRQPIWKTMITLGSKGLECITRAGGVLVLQNEEETE